MTKAGARKRCASPIWGKIGLPLPRFPGLCGLFWPLDLTSGGPPRPTAIPANPQVSEAFDLMIVVCDGCKGGMLPVGGHASAAHDKGDRFVWPAWLGAWSRFAPSIALLYLVASESV